MDTFAAYLSTLVEILRTDPNAANAFGALASAATAVFALFISVLALGASLVALHVQRRHNRLSVRPMPEVTVADFEDTLRVKIRNNGSGPLVVNDVVVSRGDETKHALIDWMPDLPEGRAWTNFTHAIRKRAVVPGGELILLELSQEETDRSFPIVRDQVRRSLRDLTVHLHFTDVYGTKFTAIHKPLSWFGRLVD